MSKISNWFWLTIIGKIIIARKEKKKALELFKKNNEKTATELADEIEKDYKEKEKKKKSIEKQQALKKIIKKKK